MATRRAPSLALARLRATPATRAARPRPGRHFSTAPSYVLVLLALLISLAVRNESRAARRRGLTAGRTAASLRFHAVAAISPSSVNSDLAGL
eukprot:2934220-Prymnesium_polylepis.1